MHEFLLNFLLKSTEKIHFLLLFWLLNFSGYFWKKFSVNVIILRKTFSGLLKVFLMLLIVNKFCWNQSFKYSCSFQGSFSWVLLFEKKKRNFWCFKATQICYLRTKFIKKRCLYSLNYDFGNKFCNLKTTLLGMHLQN